MIVTFPSCTLRPWRSGDEDALVRHANDITVWRNVRDAFPQPYTRDDAVAWIAKANADPMALSLAVEVDGEAVGGIGLIFHSDIYRRAAELGYWLGASFRGRGIMTDAVKGLVRYAFEHYDLVRIYAGIFEPNDASRRVLEKAGFTFEARLRKHVVKEGRVMDEMLFSILAEEVV